MHEKYFYTYDTQLVEMIKERREEITRELKLNCYLLFFIFDLIFFKNQK